MIGYLEGPVFSLEPERVIVNAGGVGYLVRIPLSTYYRLEGQSRAALQIHTHVREDEIALYGFATVDEKSAFEKLISITGIGPRLAQVILSGISPVELAEAIVRTDIRRLSSIPGVGRKTSERICLELRDKLLITAESRGTTPESRPTSIEDDVVSALSNLGYKPAAAEAAIKSIRGEMAGEEADFSRLLRATLRQLSK